MNIETAIDTGIYGLVVLFFSLLFRLVIPYSDVVVVTLTFLFWGIPMLAYAALSLSGWAD